MHKVYIYSTTTCFDSLGYKKQPEDGLKWAETCSCEMYVHFVHKLCCVLTANYTLLLVYCHSFDTV
jgi:hypothetical protein